MRHEYIGDDKIGVKFREQVDGVLPVAGLDHPMADGLDDLPQRQLNVGIVVDDHDECHSSRSLRAYSSSNLDTAAVRTEFGRCCRE